MSELYTSGAYASANPSWHAEDAAWKAAHIVRLLQRNNCQPHRIVDVGCGAGGVLAGVVNAIPGSEGTGFDVSPTAINMAKQGRLRPQCPSVTFINGDFLKLDHPIFDLMLCIDVFEHVDDYIGFLRALRPRAKLFAFHIPLDMNIKGLLRRHHMTERQKTGHLHYFDFMTADATLKYTGYEIVDRDYTIHEDSSLLTKAIAGTRRILSTLIGQDKAVQLLGGASLLIIARGQPQ